MTTKAPVGDSHNRLLHRKHAGSLPRLLVRRAVHADPVRDKPLLLLVQRQLLGPAPEILFATGTQVRAEAAMGFERHILCGRVVGVGVEEHAAVVRGEVAALWRRRWMDERAGRRIAQEGVGELRAVLAIGLAALGLR